LDSYVDFHERDDHILVDEAHVDFVENLNLFQRVYGIANPQKSIVNKLRFLSSLYDLSKFRFDLSINCQVNREVKSDIAMRNIKSKRKIAHGGTLINQRRFQNALTSKFYDELVHSDGDIWRQHISVFDRHLMKETLTGSGCDKRRTLQNLEMTSPFHFGCQYVVLAPGGSDPRKRLNADEYAEIIDFLLESKHADMVVLLGSENEAPLSNDIIESCKSEDVVGLTGKTSLVDYVAIIQNAKLVLSNDSSAGHVANFVSTPFITILGGGHFGMFYPYPENDAVRSIAIFEQMDCFSCNWNCPFINDNKAFPCVERISAGSVIDRIRNEVLETSG
jgi:ADP-heptose:LPS heptosyltransferase